MTCHLVIRKINGNLSWVKDHGLGTRSASEPAPIAKIELSDAEVDVPGQVLFGQWLKTRLAASEAVPVAPEGETAPTPVSTNPDEIHITPSAPGPLVLPDGRRVEIGDGLVVMSVTRFAQLVEAARFGRGEI